MEPRTLLELYPEYVLPPAQKADFLRDRKACIAGMKTALKYGWKIGDTITLKGTIFPGNYEFVLRGIYKGINKNIDETQLFFHWDYLNETLKKTAPLRADQVGFYMIGVTRSDRAADVALAIDKLFKNSIAETLTETEKAFVMGFITMSEAIIVAIQLVSFVVIIIIMAVAANTMSMTARERIGEYAIFKTLGYKGLRMAGMIIGESLVITMIGGFLGMVMTFPAAKVTGNILANYFPIFKVPEEIILMDLTASVMVGLAAAIVPTWRALKIRIADGLRRIG